MKTTKKQIKAIDDLYKLAIKRYHGRLNGYWLLDEKLTISDGSFIIQLNMYDQNLGWSKCDGISSASKIIEDAIDKGQRACDCMTDNKIALLPSVDGFAEISGPDDLTVLVDANYLKLLVVALGNKTDIFTTGSDKSPLYLSSEFGQAVLMPVRK
jgi:hypothetical protein